MSKDLNTTGATVVAASPNPQPQPSPQPSPKLKGTQLIPCKFYKSGSCSAGRNCQFMHTKEEAAPSICKFYLKGNCKFGNKCALSHGAADAFKQRDVSPTDSPSTPSKTPTSNPLSPPESTMLLPSPALAPYAPASSLRSPNMSSNNKNGVPAASSNPKPNGNSVRMSPSLPPSQQRSPQISSSYHESPYYDNVSSQTNGWSLPPAALSTPYVRPSYDTMLSNNIAATPASFSMLTHVEQQLEALQLERLQQQQQQQHLDQLERFTMERHANLLDKERQLNRQRLNKALEEQQQVAEFYMREQQKQQQQQQQQQQAQYSQSRFDAYNDDLQAFPPLPSSSSSSTSTSSVSSSSVPARSSHEVSFSRGVPPRSSSIPSLNDAASLQQQQEQASNNDQLNGGILPSSLNHLLTPLEQRLLSPELKPNTQPLFQSEWSVGPSPSSRFTSTSVPSSASVSASSASVSTATAASNNANSAYSRARSTATSPLLTYARYEPAATSTSSAPVLMGKNSAATIGSVAAGYQDVPMLSLEASAFASSSLQRAPNVTPSNVATVNSNSTSSSRALSPDDDLSMANHPHSSYGSFGSGLSFASFSSSTSTSNISTVSGNSLRSNQFEDHLHDGSSSSTTTASSYGYHHPATSRHATVVPEISFAAIARAGAHDESNGYYDAIPDAYSRADEQLCPFGINGKCRYAEYCRYVHGLPCPHCNKNVLHPYRPQEQQHHIESCLEQQQQLTPSLHSAIMAGVTSQEEIECCVCMEQTATKPDSRFGLLNCEHAFCLGCIRAWRQNSSMDPNVTHGCPVCRTITYFITPCNHWLPNGPLKDAVIEDYKLKLKNIPCKYFNYGDGTCPFGSSCFYSHIYRDGTREEIRLRKYINGEEQVRIHGQIRLSDFIDAYDDMRSSSNFRSIPEH